MQTEKLGNVQPLCDITSKKNLEHPKFTHLRKINFGRQKNQPLSRPCESIGVLVEESDINEEQSTESNDQLPVFIPSFKPNTSTEPLEERKFFWIELEPSEESGSDGKNAI